MRKMKNILISLTFVLCFAGSDSSARERTPVPELDLPTAEAVLRVFAGKSLLVTSPETLERVSVTDPDIASALITSPNQVLIHGKVPGNVTLLMWDKQERSRAFDLQVEFDISGLRETILQVFPDEKIEVGQLGTSIVLTGRVSSQGILEQALSLGLTQSENVVNLLQMESAGEKEAVLLQVLFAEVDRSAVQELGVNIISTGAGNTIGSVTTQQFDAPIGNIGAVPAEIGRGRDPQASSLVAGGIGRTLSSSPGVFGLGNLLNIFLFRPDANLAVTIRALQQRNLLEILAEPNMLALDGSEASFLAGGEFPFPIVQGGTNTAVSIVFKEFGVRLSFTPNVQEDGTILLKVAPEVSSLDFANALTISGFLVPALSTRRAETEVALRDGQSFVIAGLIDNRLAQIASKIPLLGDIPVLGKLFKSRSTNSSQTELLVMVTPRLVQPMEPDEVPTIPEFPVPFIDPEEFDREAGKEENETPQAE